ncbi:formylglycine-generating enzyme family protein, partial [Treponema sp. OttesenSCG-928-L16]|nr:formylglycine-generating enzyme family protein [Treponema sp. OttesenSCG-928-L16]
MSKGTNALRLYDMSGNVSEWCQDQADIGFSRIVRGGSWLNLAADSAVSYRSISLPSSG